MRVTASRRCRCQCLAGEMVLLGPGGAAPARPRRQDTAAGGGAVEHPVACNGATADFLISSPLVNSYAVEHGPPT